MKTYKERLDALEDQVRELTRALQRSGVSITPFPNRRFIEQNGKPRVNPLSPIGQCRVCLGSRLVFGQPCMECR